MNFPEIVAFIQENWAIIIAVLIICFPVVWGAMAYVYRSRLEGLKSENERLKSYYLSSQTPGIASDTVNLEPQSTNEKKIERIIRFESGYLTIKRRDEELAENNKYLQAAKAAKVIAMTYKTLGNTINTLNFENLEEAELCIYALPNLKISHPIIHGDQIGLELEWCQGIEATICGLLDPNRCPRLSHLDLKLLSVNPVFTGTYVQCRHNEAEHGDRIRITFVISGSEPQNIPTITIFRSSSSTYNQSIFDGFRNMINEVGKNNPFALNFVLKRPNYERKNISDFFGHLKRICNHPSIGNKDRMFELELRLKEPHQDNQKLKPFQAHDLLNTHRKNTNFKIKWDTARDILILAERGVNGESVLHLKTPHIFACFVVMKWSGRVVLVDNKKNGWQYDVPGGKVTYLDKSETEAAQREIFEELGLVIDLRKLSYPIGFIYDPKSAREADTPVIAQYYYYDLNEEEYLYLSKVAKTSTKNHQLVLFPIEQLIEYKKKNTANIESICHAPLNVVEHIWREATQAKVQ